MRCAAIKAGEVQNVLEIRPAYKLGYERATGFKLIELSDDMNVDIGDLYDEEGGVFLRDGVEVGPDGVIPALRERVAGAENQATAVEQALTALMGGIADA